MLCNPQLRHERDPGRVRVRPLRLQGHARAPLQVKVAGRVGGGEAQGVAHQGMDRKVGKGNIPI